MAPHRRLHVIIAFLLVYIFWGSTYLGLRVAVTDVPPILLAGTRFTLSGGLMLAFFALRGRSIQVPSSMLWRLAVTGFILLGLANAVLAWAEIYVPTGLAALIVSIVPIWGSWSSSTGCCRTGNRCQAGPWRASCSACWAWSSSSGRS